MGASVREHSCLTSVLGWKAHVKLTAKFLITLVRIGKAFLKKRKCSESVLVDTNSGKCPAAEFPGKKKTRRNNLTFFSPER